MKFWWNKKKHPTIEGDASAYVSGGKKTYDDTYTDYVNSVEMLDRAVRIITNVASMAKFKVYKESTKGELKPFKVKNIDFNMINEVDSSVDFLRKLFSILFVQGASVIVPEDDANRGMINFYTLDMAKVAVESDGSSLISNFIYTNEEGDEKPFAFEEVLYINTGIDPSNLLYSLSRLNSLNDVVIMQSSIMNYAKNYFGGGAKDSVIVSTDEPIAEKNQQKIKEAFDTFTDSAATRNMFINAKLKVDKVSNSMNNSQLLETLTELNDIMLGQFGLNKYLLGNFEGTAVDDKTVQVACKLFFQLQLKPVFTNIELHFTKYFRDVLGLKNAVVKFDYSEVEILEDSNDAKTERATALYKQGIISLNEARELCELLPLPDEAADKHFLPAYLLSDKPITVEDYEEQIAQRFAEDSSGDVPAGSAGGEDNEPVEDTDSNEGGANA